MDKQSHERETPSSKVHVGDPANASSSLQPAQPKAGGAGAPPSDEAKLAVGDHPEDPDRSACYVTICSWCPHLHILKLQLRDVDVLIVYQQGKERRIIRNGVNLTVTHGICEPCRARLR